MISPAEQICGTSVLALFLNLRLEQDSSNGIFMSCVTEAQPFYLELFEWKKFDFVFYFCLCLNNLMIGFLFVIMYAWYAKVDMCDCDCHES